MGMLIMLGIGKSSYVNEDAVANVIRYVTRTRKNEDRRDELIAYGGAGVGYYLGSEMMIQQFLYVQRNHNIHYRRGRRIYHEVLTIREDELDKLNRDKHIINRIAAECCMIYYQQGHQVVYAAHWDSEKYLHIHFVVNTINFIDGKKWHTDMRERRSREKKFNEIMRTYFPPISFEELMA